MKNCLIALLIASAALLGGLLYLQLQDIDLPFQVAGRGSLAKVAHSNEQLRAEIERLKDALEKGQTVRARLRKLPGREQRFLPPNPAALAEYYGDPGTAALVLQYYRASERLLHASAIAHLGLSSEQEQRLLDTLAGSAARKAENSVLSNKNNVSGMAGPVLPEIYADEHAKLLEILGPEKTALFEKVKSIPSREAELQEFDQALWLAGVPLSDQQYVSFGNTSVSDHSHLKRPTDAPQIDASVQSRADAQQAIASKLAGFLSADQIKAIATQFQHENALMKGEYYYRIQPGRPTHP
jgi:hypothetical protein